MVGGRFFIFSLILFSFASLAIADDDTNGNIRVEVTKLENTLPYLVIAVVSVVVFIAIVLSILLLARRRSGSPAPPKAEVGLDRDPEEDSPVRLEGYYDAVFQKHLQKVDIVDEKASPASLASSAVQQQEGNCNGNEVDRYLKEDERIVINVLRMKHNSCTQATIRVVTDFSKARLSRILSELEERGIIYKEQQGRKNLITLKAD